MSLNDSNPELPAPRPAGLPSTAPGAELFDCWNKIGVGGDGTCAELDKFVHCRNCPTYSAAAQRLLDRIPPSDYRRGLAEYFSKAKRRITPGELSVVVFRLGGEWFALPTNTFQEVAEHRQIHSLPHRRQGHLLGLINIRGELQLCVSLERLLGLDPSHADRTSKGFGIRLIVTKWHGNFLAFPANEIHGVHHYREEELKPAPTAIEKSGSNVIRGILPWQNKLVGCLNEEVLFTTLNRGLS